jgi:hypothetical protein
MDHPLSWQRVWARNALEHMPAHDCYSQGTWDGDTWQRGEEAWWIGVPPHYHDREHEHLGHTQWRKQPVPWVGDLFIFSLPPLLLSFRSLKPRVAAILWPSVTLLKYVSFHTLALTSLRRRALRAEDEIWYITGLRRWRLSETTADQCDASHLYPDVHWFESRSSYCVS